MLGAFLLLLAAQVLEVEIEVLRPGSVPLAAFAQRQDLVHEHRQDQAAFLGEQLAGLLEQLRAFRRIDGRVRLQQHGVIIRPLPVGLLPFGALGVGDRQAFARRAHRPRRGDGRLFQPDVIPKLSAGVTITLMSKPAGLAISANTCAMRTIPGTPSAV